MEDHSSYSAGQRPGDGEYGIRDNFEEERRPRAGSSAEGGEDSPYAGAIGGLRALLEHQLRERPLPTLLLGVAAGWLAGKLLR